MGYATARDALEQHYDAAFYADQIPDSMKSAQAVLQVLFDLHKPTSLLDIGCGQGTWLAVAERLGVTALTGLDGPWIRKDALLSKVIDFTAVNMEGDIPITRRYDLAMSVEVAEHLSARRASSIVKALCQASDVVMFGAAVIGQGGENHINEQRQSYWAALFDQQGYECKDVLRPAVWNTASVAPWYRQNTLVYVSRQRTDLLQRFGRAAAQPILDIIHPEMFEKRVATYRNNMIDPTLRMCLSLFKTYLSNRLRWHASSRP
ncbi:MAG: hypothetical protein J0L57_01475 [Burkholderiales bacterium]|nr:hypothetical protein [Burkholderiales bacterium]